MTPTATTSKTQHCVRCGATIPLGTAMCDNCNPLGLSQPAASQVHGSVLLVLFLGIVGLAVLGRIALTGIGPFNASIGNVVATPPYLSVTLTVTNQGSSAGSTTCRIYDPASIGIGPDSAFILSPRIDPGQTISFSKEVTTLGSTVRSLAVDCPKP